MKIHYVTASKDGCSLVQCYIPAKYLSRIEGVYSTLSSYPEFVNEKSIREADVVVLQRQVRNTVFQYMKANKNKQVFIYDLDDDLWSIPSDYPTKRFWPDSKLKIVDMFIRECGILTVHSEGVYKNMCERFSGTGVRVYLLPPLVDFEKANGKRRAGRKDVRIGWQGSPTHRRIIEHVSHAVANYVRKRDAIGVWFGYAPSVIKVLPWWKWEYYSWVDPDNFYEVLGSLDLDIALAPLSPSKFEATRSIRKILDYGMFGYPVIATDTPPFSSIAKGVYFPVSSSNDLKKWEKAIREMAESESAREEFSEKSYNFALKFDANKRIKEWLEVYEECKRGR